MRVVRVFVSLALIPLVPFGILGLGLQAIASLGRRQFVVIRPAVEAPFPNQTVKTVKLGTFNLCMMLDCVNIFFHNLPPSRERVQAAADGVLKSGVDVLCMQEAFNTEAAIQFIKLIKETYPYIIYNAGSQPLKLGSGLLIASRFPLENPKYWEHSTKIGTERLSCKGTIAATVRLSETQRVPIFNTHLEAGLDDPVNGVECRVKQLQDIQGHMSEYCKDYQTSFLCGDMNIPSKGDSPDVIQLKEMIEIDPNDVARKRGTLHRAFPKVHSDRSCDCLKNTLKSRDVDHIGVHKSAKVVPELIESQLKCFNGVSDHVAYIATFECSTLGKS